MKRHIYLLPLLALGAMLMSSCTNETEVPVLDSSDDMKKLYADFSNWPTFDVSIISVNDARSNETEAAIPVLSQDFFSKLSSMSESEIKDAYDNLVSAVGDEKIDSILDYNYDCIYNIMQNNENMIQLTSFTEAYIKTSGGWEDLHNLLPANFDKIQKDMCIALSVVIDKTYRSLYQFITKSEPQSRSTHCDMLLLEELTIAAGAAAVEIYLDVLSDGALALFDPDVTVINAMGIYMEYEACKGRWH